MVSCTLSWRTRGVSLAVFALGFAAAAHAADVTVTDAKVAGGKLVITGKTTNPNTRVRLDGRAGAIFNVISNAQKAFKFSLIYLPDDCIVTLQKLTPPATLGPATNAVVSSCGPRGVEPRGGWSASVSYFTDDLVLFQGSTWRAKRKNLNKQPTGGPDWQVFAAQGATGPQGIQGAIGPQGPQGVQGPVGPSTGPAGGDLAGSYPNPTIATGAVAGAEIADGSITSADVSNESLTSIDLATDSVNATEIANNSIDSGEISDDSLFASDLGANSVGSSEIASGAVGNAELGGNSVDGSKVANNSLTTADIAGADINPGIISIGAGAVANGRCKDFSIGVGGAVAGEAVVLSLKATLPEGILLYGARVPSDGIVTLKICNLSGGAMPAFTDLPIRVITFG